MCSSSCLFVTLLFGVVVVVTLKLRRLTSQTMSLVEGLNLQGSGESELKAEAETTAQVDKRSSEVLSASLQTEGEAAVTFDSYSGLPKLPIEPLESEESDGTDETPTVTLSLWHYNHELGLTKVMSNSSVTNGASPIPRKSVTFDEQSSPLLLRRGLEGSGSDKVSPVCVTSVYACI